MGRGEVARYREEERTYDLTDPSMGVETVARDGSLVLTSQHPETSNVARRSIEGRKSLAVTVRARA